MRKLCEKKQKAKLKSRPKLIMSASGMDVQSIEICRAYRNNGKCRYGDDCKFEHSEGEPIANPPRGKCFSFEQDGDCQYGNRCR